MTAIRNFTTQRRSVAGIAVKNGKLFIAKRLPGGAMSERWEFPGGKVDPEEDDLKALIREYQEEFGLDIRTGEKLASAEFEHNEKQRILTAYRIHFDTAITNMTEHSEWRWASLKEIRQLDFADSDLKLLDELEQKLK